MQQCRTKTNGSSRICETSHQLQPRGANNREDRSEGLDIVLVLKEALDKLQDFWDVDPLGISDAGAVTVRHEGINAQNDIRSAEQIRAARVAKAGTPLALRWVSSKFDKHITDAVFTGDKLRRRVVAGEGAQPDRRAASLARHSYPLLRAFAASRQ